MNGFFSRPFCTIKVPLKNVAQLFRRVATCLQPCCLYHWYLLILTSEVENKSMMFPFCPLAFTQRLESILKIGLHNPGQTYHLKVHSACCSWSLGPLYECLIPVTVWFVSSLSPLMHMPKNPNFRHKDVVLPIGPRWRLMDCSLLQNSTSSYKQKRNIITQYSKLRPGRRCVFIQHWSIVSTILHDYNHYIIVYMYIQ